MKNLFIALLITTLPKFALHAQDTTADIIKQGTALNNQGKYAEAIEKFNQALKNDPENAYANYQLAVSLYATKKGQAAIPYLTKATKTDNAPISTGAYNLLASVYNESNQSQKAIDNYNQVIKLNPDYPNIYYNLGLAYSRDLQYQQAEMAAINAIKKNPKHAASQRLYALATFHQNKRANALMGFCSFILLEPNSPLATEAYGNIQHILQGGKLVDAKSETAPTLSPAEQKEIAALNVCITAGMFSATGKQLKGAELLEAEFKTIFGLTVILSQKKTNKTFFESYYATWFFKLSQSPNMPAFTRTIALTDKTMSNSTWLAQHPDQVTALNDWVKITERNF